MQGRLVADVPHAEEHGGNEGDDDHDHGTLQINGIAHMAAALRDAIGREGKSLEGLEGALKPSELAALHEVWLDFVNETTQVVEHHTASFLNFSKASRIMAWMSVFEVSMNSQRAKSSGSTS